MPRKKRIEAGTPPDVVWQPQRGLTIEYAAEHWREATTLTGGPTLVDLSLVERADTSGVQLLIALRRRAATRTAAWRLVGCGTQTLELIRMLGGVEAVGLDGENHTEAGDRS